MDYVRSCYSTRVRFFRDSDLEVTVRWYFCKPGAAIFPHYTLFGSGNWASDKFNWLGPGEVEETPRPWNNGATPAWADGQRFCGRPDQYADGLLLSDGKRVGYRFDGAPCCCVGLVCPNMLGSGGSVGGGAAAINQTGVFCGLHQMATHVYCFVTRSQIGLSLCEQFLNTYGRLDWNGTQWVGAVGPLTVRFDKLFPGGLFEVNADAPCVMQYQTGFSLNCVPFRFTGQWDFFPQPGCVCQFVNQVFDFEIREVNFVEIGGGGSAGDGSGLFFTGAVFVGAGGSVGNGSGAFATAFAFVGAGGSVGNGAGDMSSGGGIAGSGGSVGNGAADFPHNFSLLFDGATGWLSFASSITLPGQLTWAVWLMPSGLPFLDEMAAISNTTFGNMIGVSQLSVGFRAGNSLARVFVGLTAAVWTHLAITRDAGNTVEVFKNGVSVGTTSNAQTLTLNDLALHFDGAFNPWWSGWQYKPAYWNTVLSGADIASLAAMSVDPGTLSPLGYWPMTEGAGSVAGDVVSGNDGTLTGGVTWSNVVPP